jgi:predicted DNA-binding transcriptional regulator YafY
MTERVERLTNLLALLLETSAPLSLVEIAGELSGQYPEKEAARRGAFERDKAALREMGVPIEQEVVVGGPYAGSTKYWIDRARYELADLHLEPDEMRALQVAVAATRTGSSDLGQEAMWKLGSGVIDRDAAVMATMPSLPGLPMLRDATARRATVRFVYRDVERTVEPYGLLLRDGFWYLVGFDRTRGDRRTFRVDRIDGRITMGRGDEFERSPGLDLRTVLPDPKVLGAEGDTQDAIVRVDATRAAAVVRELGADRVVDKNPNADVDDAVDVRVPCANREAFRSWVLGLLEHAEVRSPSDVRADIVEWLERQASG